MHEVVAPAASEVPIRSSHVPVTAWAAPPSTASTIESRSTGSGDVLMIWTVKDTGVGAPVAVSATEEGSAVLVTEMVGATSVTATLAAAVANTSPSSSEASTRATSSRKPSGTSEASTMCASVYWHVAEETGATLVPSGPCRWSP